MKMPEPFLSRESIESFLHQLRALWGVNFLDYSAASVNRRLSKICLDYGFSKLEDLWLYLQENPWLKTDFLDRFTVNVTEMFRDPGFFKALMGHLALDVRPNYQIWHPGCSSGEEILSLAILLHMQNSLDQVKFLGSDINEKVLERATHRLVKARHMTDYEKAFTQTTGEVGLRSFFEPAGKEELSLRRNIPLKLELVLHDVTSLTPIATNKYELIVCRNLMIYFNPALQSRVLQFLVDSLKIGGIICLGSKESIVFMEDLSKLEILNADERIYRRTY